MPWLVVPTLDLRERTALSAALTFHLHHEESKALPLIASVLIQREWEALGVTQRRAIGIKGAASFLSWLLDGANESTRQHILRLLPRPVRLLHHFFWQFHTVPARHQASRAASVHRRALITWLAVYPAITLVQVLIGHYIAGLPVAARTLLITVLVVPLVVYPLLPLLNRLDGALARRSR